MSQFFIYKFNHRSSYYYAPGFTLTPYSLILKPIPEVFKKVFVYDFISFLRFPYFEDGIIVNYLPEGNFFPYGIFGLGKYDYKLINPAFADYFFENFFYNDFFDDLLIPSGEEVYLFYGLNSFHFYHFDYFYDTDLIVKFVYKSFLGDFEDFLAYAYDSDVSKIY